MAGGGKGSKAATTHHSAENMTADGATATAVSATERSQRLDQTLALACASNMEMAVAPGAGSSVFGLESVSSSVSGGETLGMFGRTGANDIGGGSGGRGGGSVGQRKVS